MDLVFMDTWTYGDAVMPEKYREDVWAGRTPGSAPPTAPTHTRDPSMDSIASSI